MQSLVECGWRGDGMIGVEGAGDDGSTECAAGIGGAERVGDSLGVMGMCESVMVSVP